MADQDSAVNEYRVVIEVLTRTLLVGLSCVDGAQHETRGWRIIRPASEDLESHISR